MIPNRITILKHDKSLYIYCPFCDGYIPIDFDQDHDNGNVRIKGRCKKCSSYLNIMTQRSNIITNW